MLEQKNKAEDKDALNQTINIEKPVGLDITNISTDASGRKRLNLNSTMRVDSELGSRTSPFTQGRVSPAMTFSKLPQNKRMSLRKFEETQEGQDQIL